MRNLYPRLRMPAAAIAACLLLSSCGEQATLPIAAGMGPDPVLPAPRITLLPTVNIAPARGWTGDSGPAAAAGLVVVAYARGLDHPRWLGVLPNGDVLVAESNAPTKTTGTPSLKNWVMQRVMKRAGAGTRSADRITLLRDNDGDGIAEIRSVILGRLKSPFGMALVGERLFVATTDAVLVFPYRGGETTISAAPVKLLDLPGGSRNHHWTKNILASPDGTKLYVAIGSNSNIAEHGMAVEQGRAAIWEVTLKTGAQRIYASGLRNPVGMAWMASNKSLWTVVNERDELGSDLVPDYLTAIHDGGFYGWPYSYFGQHVDGRVTPARPDRVASAIIPDYALGAHTASLGLASSAGSTLAGPFVHGLFVAQHGSWNRAPASGYKVIFIPFDGDTPRGPPLDVLTGFVNGDGEAQGRPAGIAIDSRGALLVADDVGNVVWRVTAQR